MSTFICGYCDGLGCTMCGYKDHRPDPQGVPRDAMAEEMEQNRLTAHREVDRLCALTPNKTAEEFDAFVEQTRNVLHMFKKIQEHYKARLNRLGEWSRKWCRERDEAQAERDAARAECERLKKLVDYDTAGILKLDAENARLRAALEKIADLQHHQVVSGHGSWQQIAREALKPDASNESLTDGRPTSPTSDVSDSAPKHDISQRHVTAANGTPDASPSSSCSETAKIEHAHDWDDDEYACRRCGARKP